MYLFTLKSFVKQLLQTILGLLNLPPDESLKNLDLSDIFSIISFFSLLLASTTLIWFVRAFGLYKMAKAKNDKFAFLAFIPYGDFYIMGKIIGPTKIFGMEIDYPEIILPLLLLSMLFPLTSSLSIFIFVLFYYAILYKIHKLKWKGYARLAIIISLFLPILQPLFIFIFR
ncbi:MAG: hypothetical protein PHR25_04985 [Clostridia bacterium]|nr:hypothetical protein [Clostridia bacterium]MDD4376119.1 hypothetical protein [Clostridia bacterium]